jgi:recombinational DNA repair protein (RecF pathway)
MQCAMIVGYLVPHRCPNKALAKCIKCSREFCDEHVSIVENGLICLACQKGLEQPVLSLQEGQRYSAADLALFSALGAADSAEDSFSDLS